MSSAFAKTLYDNPIQRCAQNWASAQTQVAAWRAAGERVVFTNGCFDLLHVGHVTYLAEARTLGDRLVVGLNSDASVQRLKGNSRPIQALSDRSFILAGLRSVDLVVPFAEDTPLALIEALAPDVLVKGGDYSLESIVGAAETLARGGRVEVLSFVAGRSTSRIIDRME